MDNRPVFGIDLGTTNSAISVVREGNRPECLPLYYEGCTEPKYTMPSCVMWKDGKFTVGAVAYANRAEPYVCYSIKRVMQEPDAQFTFVDGENTLTLSAVEISSLILKGIVEETRGDFGEVKDVIITVPAYFNQIGRDNTREAAITAGLNPIAIINEPTAAILLYDSSKEAKDVLAFDLGGGTFDVTLARVGKTANEELVDFYHFDDSDDFFPDTSVQVLATDGDSMLGGDDIDKELLRIVLKKLEDEGYDTSKFSNGYKEYLLLQLENLKKQGSDSDYRMPIDCRCTDGTEFHASVFVTAEDFRNSVMPVLDKALRKVKSVLNSVENQCNTIVLVGGSTKNCWIRKALEEEFGDVCSINFGFDADRSVAEGAAVYGKSVKFGDASVQVFDIIGLPIGISDGGEFSTILNKGMTLPASVTTAWTTAYDNQTELHVEIYQGDKRRVKDCTWLGTLHVTDLPPAPAQELDVFVTVKVSLLSKLTCSVQIGDRVEELPPLDLGGRKKEPRKKVDRRANQIENWRVFAGSLRKEGKDSVAEELEAFVDKFEAGDDEVRASINRILQENM